MPQVCGHFVVAEKVKEALNNPNYLQQNQEALMLGAIGPDLFLLLFDTPMAEDYQKHFNKTISFYDTIHEAKEIFNDITNKIGGPIEDLAEWLLGDFNTRLINIASLSSVTLLEAFKMNLVAEAGSVTIRNPYAGHNIPGVSNEEYLTIEASDLSKVLRNFGHPYSEDSGYKECAEQGTYKDWWWMDILHYRRTVPFARALLNNCGDDPLLKAYAVGYYSHVSADICGHPYTNALVGGPFRTHTIRHIVLENISDTWIWNHYHQEDIVNAELNLLIDLSDDDVEKIANFLIAQLEAEYPDQIFNGKAKPTQEELTRAYTTMKHFLRMATTSGIEPPEPPPSGFVEYLEEISDSIAGTAGSIADQFDSDNEWWEWLLAPFLAAAYSAVLLFKLVTAPAALIRNMAETPLRWYAYEIQRTLWQYIMDARWELSLGGWGKPSSIDLNREFAIHGYRIPSPRSGTGSFDYPFKQVPRNIHGFWMKDPSESSELEDIRTECSPYPKMSTPEVYIGGDTYDNGQDLNLKRFSQLPLNPDGTIAIEKETYTGSQFGNAVDFTLKLLNDEYPNAGFDLDADFGYGALCWTKGVNGEPKYDKENIK